MLPGGPAGKSGDRYEAHWTVYQLLRVLREEVDSIRLEPPGTEFQGFEFWVKCSQGPEYHQVKRQQTGRAGWTLRNLAREGVLQNFSEKLGSSEQAKCFFVSTQDARQLRELAERSQVAISLEEFKRSCLSDKASDDFDKLTEAWSTTEDIAFRWLQRVEVQQIPESTLRRLVDCQLTRLVTDPSKAQQALFQFVFDQIHKNLNVSELWNFLDNEGFQRTNWAQDNTVLFNLDQANARYRRSLETDLICHQLIPRRETQTLLEAFNSGGQRIAVVTGIAGSGKSGVLLELTKNLEDRSIPMAALRVDRLDPVRTPKAVGQRNLELPDSPAKVLAVIAKDQECWLIVDQLDAVGKVSGRNPDFYECILEIVDQTRAYPNMRVVLACRKFDLDNDERFRQLTAQDGRARDIAVAELDAATVTKIVKDLGYDNLTAAQRQLLSLPLFLSLFSKIASSRSEELASFQSGHDLFSLFWSHVRTQASAGFEHQLRFTEVIDALCDHMSDKQRLSVPAAVLDSFQPDAQRMTSEGMLTFDDSQYSFFHESFCDYAFARRFAGRGIDLVEWLLTDEQHLFHRAQIRQILQYQRDGDPPTYLCQLDAVLREQKVRSHLRSVVFAWLANLKDPRQEEWAVLSSLLKDCKLEHGDKLWRGTTSILHRSPQWFQLACTSGDLEHWLGALGEAKIDELYWVLMGRVREQPEAVASIALPYSKNTEFKKRTVRLISFAPLDESRPFLDAFLALIADGTYDKDQPANAGLMGFWSLIREIARKSPDRASEAIAAMIGRARDQVLLNGGSDPFEDNATTIPRSQGERSATQSAYQGDPVAFLNNLLGLVFQIIQDNATNTRSGLVGDSIWELRLLEDSYSIEEQLLAGVDAGLRKLATDEPDLFREEARSLSESKMETAQFLVARAYTANPERFADEAGEFLCAVEGRLQLSSGANQHATTTDLLKAITPHCSDKVLRNIEKKVLAFYPDYEKTVDGHRQYGRAQHALLNVIASQRRSTGVKRRVGELNHKFGSPQRGRRFIEGGVVRSPISENAMDKMTDEQWLSAIRRYGSEQTRFVESGPPVGGALELSRSLEERAKSQPKRFANLLKKLPATSNPYFFQALIRGISAGGPGMGTVIRACEVVHAIPGTDAGRWICDAIEKLADEQVPDPAMNMIIYYATEDPDPDREWWLPDTEGGAAGYGEDPSHAGLNSTRGRAALAMAQLIRAKPERWRRLRDAVERMVCDPSVAVRSCVGRTVLAIFSIEPRIAIELFQRLTDVDERLLATDHVEAFIHYAIRNHYDELAPTLTRMVESAYPAVRTAGGRQLSLASLFHEEAQELLSACLAGPKDIRKGVAQVCAANVTNASHRRFCIETLAMLFNDPEEEVRDEASAVFWQKNDSFAELRELVTPFIESAAFEKDHEYLFRALDESAVAIPEETIRASQLFLDLAGPDAGNISSGASTTADHAARIILRLYQQTHDGAIKSQCLDLIDRMTDLSVYGLDKSLASVER